MIWEPVFPPDVSGIEYVLAMNETVQSLGTLSFSIERLEHARIGETFQVGLTYWRRTE